MQFKYISLFYLFKFVIFGWDVTCPAKLGGWISDDEKQANFIKN